MPIAGSLEPVRLLLIDDRALYRDAIGGVCGGTFHFQVVGQYGAFQEAIPRFPEADVVLVRDNLLPLWAESGGAKILVMADTLDVPGSLEFLRRGACGIVSQNTSPESLAVAIRQVATGGVWFDSSIIGTLARKVAGQGKAPTGLRLTDRELEVLDCIFAGLPDREIAVKLEVKISAVKAAVRRLLERAGARRRSQLVRFFLARR
jgi:two-component system, NarL family, nitrate/nitrite response regulator NarL